MEDNINYNSNINLNNYSKEVILPNNYQKFDNINEYNNIKQNKNKKERKPYQFSNNKMNNNNLFLELSFPEIIINPNYLEEISNTNTRVNYRQSITNKQIFDENEKNDEINERNIRDEFREEIIAFNPKYKEKILINDKNNIYNNKFRSTYIYKNKKPYIQYISKNNKHKKCKTFIKQMNYDDIKQPKIEDKIINDYNIKFPEEDKPNVISRETENSSDDENMKTFKKDIQNINKYNSLGIIKNNNISTKFKNNKNIFSDSKLNVKSEIIENKNLFNNKYE